jgi:hypothetical protein
MTELIPNAIAIELGSCLSGLIANGGAIELRAVDAAQKRLMVGIAKKQKRGRLAVSRPDHGNTFNENSED